MFFLDFFFHRNLLKLFESFDLHHAVKAEFDAVKAEFDAAALITDSSPPLPIIHTSVFLSLSQTFSFKKKYTRFLQISLKTVNTFLMKCGSHGKP